MTSSARRLLRDLDSLPFPARQRMLADTARTLAASAELDALLDDLATAGNHHARNGFARRVAFTMAAVARHHRYIEGCLSSPEASLAQMAFVTAVRLDLPAEVFVSRMAELPVAVRRTLYRAVRRHRARELAEVLLPTVRRLYGDHEAAGLLPTCSPATVATVLPEIDHAVANWAMLGRLHPSILLDYLDTQLSESPHSAWAGLWSRVASGVALAVPVEPARVLDLLERSMPHTALPAELGRSISVLARHDPARLLRLLTDPRRPGAVPGGRALWRSLVGAVDADLIVFARVLATNGERLTAFLHTLPPSRRAAIYAGVVGDRDPFSVGVPISALDELPIAVRTAEARRLLGLRRVADDPVTRLAVTARLAWTEAKPVLHAATRRATAKERAAAYPLYVAAGAASRDPAVFAEILGSLARLANEQDPVRTAALSALASVPPWLFRPQDVDVLATLMSDAAQARDCSWHTRRSIRTLADRLIREGAASGRPPLVEAGMRGMEQLGGQVSWPDLSGLDRGLPRGAEHEVFATLRPRIVADARRGRYTVALCLASGLGRRAWHMPELQRFVDQARSAADDTTVRRAIDLWLRPAATRDERVARTLRADRSTITLPVVQQAVAWRRTDLLDEVLTRRSAGRFLARGVRYLPQFPDGCFDHWLPRQVLAYTESLIELATRPNVPVHERATAVRMLGPVPGSAPALRGFLADPAVPVVEAALAALAWTDEPGASLPLLLGYADTDRARVAVYSAVRCARFVPPARLGEHLGPALIAGSKVTSRKEAARLLAELHAPDGAALLAQAWAAPRQHRDVRRALISATRWLLDDERVWTLLADATNHEHAVATAVLDVSPLTIAARHRTRWAGLVRAVAASSTPDTARLGLAALARWSRWDIHGTGMLVDRVTDRDNTATWQAALGALVTTCDVAGDTGPLRTVADRLLDGTRDAFDHDRFDAAPDRDRPARQRLAALADAVRAAARTSPTLHRAAGELADVLATVGTLRGITVELAVAAISWDSPDAGLDQLRHVVRFADRPVLAWQAHHALGRATGSVVRRLSRERVHAVAESLAADHAPANALLALALAAHAGPEAGWPEPWRALLRRLRRHPDPDVAGAALDIVTSPE